jgi:poly(3-hydroxybutyrate) depolymerase
LRCCCSLPAAQLRRGPASARHQAAPHKAAKRPSCRIARCEAHEGCAADVVFCSLAGGGHTWPGGTRAPFLGRTSSDIDATATILDFFAAHPRPAAARRPVR